MNIFFPSPELYLTETPVPNNGYSLVGIDLPVQGRRRGQQRSFTPLSGRNLPAGVALSPTRRGGILKRFSNLTGNYNIHFFFRSKVVCKTVWAPVPARRRGSRVHEAAGKNSNKNSSFMKYFAVLIALCFQDFLRLVHQLFRGVRPLQPPLRGAGAADHRAKRRHTGTVYCRYFFLFCIDGFKSRVTTFT